MGLDGLKDDDELEYFKELFVDKLSLSSQASSQIKLDISADNFEYYLGENFDASDKKIIE